MSRPAGRELRLIELLPGGEQITSRPIRVVAYMDDRGMAVVQKSKEGTPDDVLNLLATFLAAAAMWFDAPPAVVAYQAITVASQITLEGGDE